MNNTVSIRSAKKSDFDDIWGILEPIFRAGETYAIEPDISKCDALSYWAAQGNYVFVVEDQGLLGTYYIKPNGRGYSDHFCNCGFAVSSDAEGRGLARAMLSHALITAKGLGYKAMQFNFVLESNDRAIATWERAGFETIGRIPDAYRHPSRGMTDARIMYKKL